MGVPQSSSSSSSSSSIRCANASRFFSDSPRDTRHSHSLLDRRPKTQLQQRIKVRIHGFEHLPEHPVDLVGVDRGQRHPADQVDVAHVVQRVGHPIEPAVALEQEPVDALVVLVGLAADERLHAHRMLADAQDGVGLELAFAGQFHDQPRRPAVRARMLRVAQLAGLQRPLDQRLHVLRSGHAPTPRRGVQRRGLRIDARSNFSPPRRWRSAVKLPIARR